MRGQNREWQRPGHPIAEVGLRTGRGVEFKSAIRVTQSAIG